MTGFTGSWMDVYIKEFIERPRVASARDSFPIAIGKHLIAIFISPHGRVEKALRVAGVLALINMFLQIYLRRRAWLSLIVWKFAIKQHISFVNFRSEFGNVPMVSSTPVTHHTHGKAAAARSTAISMIKAYAARLGLRYYSVQKSASDNRQRVAGSREYHWPKDLVVEPEEINIKKGDLVSMIDVDYYVEMEQHLATHDQPVVLYTFIPDKVCGTLDGYSYTFDYESNLVMQVAGGAPYKHPLWNYGRDTLFVFKRIMGLPFRSTMYLIDRRRVAENRYVVLLTPSKTFGVVGSWLLRFFGLFTEFDTLKRLVVAHGKHLRLMVQDQTGLMCSTAAVGHYSECTIPIKDDNTAELIAKNTKLDVSIPQLQSVVEDRSKAVILVDYLRESNGCKPDFVFPVAMGVRKYQVLKGVDYVPEAKSSCVPFMSPIFHGCFAPDQTLGNERTMIDERITKVATEVPVTTSMVNYVQEFARLLVPDPQVGHPLEYDDVNDNMKRPSQRRIAEESSWSINPFRVVKSFMKKETYGEPKAPRPISTINGDDKMRYSRYTLAFSRHLKTTKWYAFGLTPKEVAHRVAHICSGLADETGQVKGPPKSVALSDFSKCDGRVSNFIRYAEQVCDMLYFDPKYHDELLDLTRSQHHIRGYCTFGTSYDSEYARLSGSPETSAKNSFLNALIHFIAFRMDGFPAEIAYGKLGIYGGDDGLTADLSADSLAKASSMAGQVAVANVIKFPNLGVKFLSRYYSPEVWYGEPESTCDIARQLAKFHTTVSLPVNVSPTMKLLEKALAYVMSDSNTPIIGAICRRALELATPKEKQDNADNLHVLKVVRPWHTLIDAEVQYPNENIGNWANHLVLMTLPGFDSTRLYRALQAATTLNHLLHLPLCIEVEEAKVKFTDPVVVDGDLYLPIAPRDSFVSPHPTSPNYQPSSPTVQPYSPTEPPPIDWSEPNDTSYIQDIKSEKDGKENKEVKEGKRKTRSNSVPVAVGDFAPGKQKVQKPKDKLKTPPKNLTSEERKTNGVCFAFRKKRCKFGDNCKYEHAKPAKRPGKIAIPPKTKVAPAVSAEYWV
jgi:hypothetical protein